MAASSNTTWLKGFTGNPNEEDREERSLAALVAAIGDERVIYPTGGDDARPMTRTEALVRTLWTRGVIDGDMTAIKALVDLLTGKATGDGGGPVFTAEQLRAAELELERWRAAQVAGERGEDDGFTA